MFYSLELLGKKSPLGAVWIAGHMGIHGKKLKRGNILSVDIAETCDKIMDPEVPQALRLQAILVGGVVVIFNKQQMYLLDDCNEMMKKIQLAMTNPSSNRNMLEKGKRKARNEAVTVEESRSGLDFDSNLTLTLNPGLADEHNDIYAMLTDEQEQFEQVELQPSASNPLLASAHARLDSLLLPQTHSADGYNLLADDEMFDPALQDAQPDHLAEYDDVQMADILYDNELLPVPPEEEIDLQPISHQSPSSYPLHHSALGQPSSVENPILDDFVPPDDGPDPLPQPPAGGGPQDTNVGRPAKQAKRRIAKKRKNRLVIDSTDNIMLPGRDFRQWLFKRSDIITWRPKRPRRSACQPSPGKIHWQPALVAITGHPLAQPLQDLFSQYCEPIPGGQPGKPPLSTPSPLNAGTRAIQNKDAPYQPDVGVDGYADHLPMPAADANMLDGFGPVDGYDPGSSIDPTQGPSSNQEQAPLSEDVERLRAALDTPMDAGAVFDLQQGWTPNLSAGAKRKGTGSGGRRVRSAVRPESDDSRNTKRSRDQLVDLDEEADLLGNLGPDACLEDMLPAVPEGDLDASEDGLSSHPTARKTRQPAGLTQFQVQVGTSGLLEETAAPTQLTPPVTLNQNTAATLTVLKAKFKEQQPKGPVPAAPLQMSKLTTSFSRVHAAKLFYQICVGHSQGLFRAEQMTAYGEIFIYEGITGQQQHGTATHKDAAAGRMLFNDDDEFIE